MPVDLIQLILTLLLGIGGILGSIAAAFYTPIIGDWLQTYVWKKRHQRAFYSELLFIRNAMTWFIAEMENKSKECGIIFHVSEGLRVSRGAWQCLSPNGSRKEDYERRFDLLKNALDNIRKMQKITLYELIVEKGNADSLSNFYQLSDASQIGVIYQNLRLPFEYKQIQAQGDALAESLPLLSKKLQSELINAEAQFQTLKKYCNVFGDALRDLSNKKLLQKLIKTSESLTPSTNAVTQKLDQSYVEHAYKIDQPFSQLQFQYNASWQFWRAGSVFGAASLHYTVGDKRWWQTSIPVNGFYAGTGFRERSCDNECTDSPCNRDAASERKAPHCTGNLLWHRILIEVFERDLTGHLIKRVVDSDRRVEKLAQQRARWWINLFSRNNPALSTRSDAIDYATQKTGETWWIASSGKPDQCERKVIIHLKKPGSNYNQIYGTDVVLDTELLKDDYVITIVDKADVSVLQQNV